ncbi:hypothetical protein YYC_05867 [Plasmodium yoelii 17X]|uniref:Uncharacterized protein n=1 Tax=Plasmodium yoelii 17X TaxID=1323249 RepID=V7PAU7_PLAYE|nr:hypothetical protein YYC_05867 [Plasmodium yoelii 17X]
MNKQVCEKFQEVRNSLPDQLDSSGNYQFKDEDFLNNYCDSNQCQSYFDRISAGCLYLLDQFYKYEGLLPSPSISNPNIVDYILIWLSYILNMGKSKGHNNINDFYNPYINSCDKYKKEISELNDYKNYKGLIDARKNLLYMDSNIVSEFYEAFKSLCNLYNELGDDNTNCKNYLDDDNEFFKKYKELEKNTSITGNYLYNQLLSTLLTDYNGFKKVCNDTSSSTSKGTEQTPGLTPGLIAGLTHVDSYGEDANNFGKDVHISGQDAHNSEVTPSSSSITTKLIPVLLIFGAIPIFLGISYKVNNKELKNYFHYIYANINKKIVRFLIFYISIHYLDFGNDLKNI